MHDSFDTHDFKTWQYILLAAVLVLGFLVIYKVHWDYDYPHINPYAENIRIYEKNVYYPYPMHADEWQHLASVQYMMDHGKIPSVNPNRQDTRHLDLESGFHSFLAALFASMGLDPVLSYQFLAAAFMVVT